MGARGRKVRFHGRVQFKTIRHVAEFTEEEIMMGWYRKKDFMRMSDEVSDIANMVAKGSAGSEDLCIRGLEHLVEEDVADYRAEKMIASIDAVLDEQDEQRDQEMEDLDWDAIATIYTEIVSPLLREAYLVGLRDAKEATAAAEQIPDLKLEELEISPPKEKEKKKKKDKKTTPKKTKSMEKEAEEREAEESGAVELNDAEEEKRLQREAARAAARAKMGVKLLKETQKKKVKPAPRKKRDRSAASEVSPFTRSRDGKIVFRNKDLEHAKKELSKQRRNTVRDSLFKFLDD